MNSSCVQNASQSELEAAAPVTSPIGEKPARPLRAYQKLIVDSQAGTLVLHWARQIGKSHVLATWAVDRMVEKLKNNPAWLITVLSNSRDNGSEFCLKAAQICDERKAAFERTDTSPNVHFKDMRMEIRITLDCNGKKHVGRIKVLAANPRTARGFSGDLILDEFAFHDNSHAIWEAAEPILAANQEYQCRIASTGNGKHNLFFRIASGPGPNDGSLFQSTSGFTVSRLSRTEAYKMGVQIFDPNTRAEISPETARAKALDKTAYDQNYECQFNDENACLLTYELIQSAERNGIPIDDQAWSERSLERLRQAEGDLFLGGDIARHGDYTVFVVLEMNGPLHRLVALLRLRDQRLPQQQTQLDPILALPKFRRACLDTTGLGLGLAEYAQEKWGRYKVQGVNFATTEPISNRVRLEGRRAETARVTELMAIDLLTVFEERSLTIEVILDADAREDLRKPEKITSPGGRVSIASQRDAAGHADHFWALALAIRAAQNVTVPLRIVPPSGHRAQVIAARRIREFLG